MVVIVCVTSQCRPAVNTPCWVWNTGNDILVAKQWYVLPATTYRSNTICRIISENELKRKWDDNEIKEPQATGAKQDVPQ